MDWSACVTRDYRSVCQMCRVSWSWLLKNHFQDQITKKEKENVIWGISCRSHEVRKRNIRNSQSHARAAELLFYLLRPISHFPVAPSLCFNARLSVKPLIWKWFFILMQIKLIFTRKFLLLAYFWKWELSEHITRKWPFEHCSVLI